MPGFKIHISASTSLGIGYGAAAHLLYGVPLPTAALGATLCSVAGMLPDLDSGPGKPMNESIAAAAAAIPMMLVDRFRAWGWPHETMILVGAATYLFIRFGVGHTIKHWTVHRGIFHSFPIALLFTELAFIGCSTGELEMRYFKAGGITIGFLSHLILDEIWSIDFRHARLKSSFGTALKFWCPCWWSNAIAYTITAATSLLTFNDPIWLTAGGRGAELHRAASSILSRFNGADKFIESFQARVNSEGEAVGARLTAEQNDEGQSAAAAPFSLPTPSLPSLPNLPANLPSLPNWSRPIPAAAPASATANFAPTNVAPAGAPNTGAVRFVERKSFNNPPPQPYSSGGTNDAWNR